MKILFADDVASLRRSVSRYLESEGNSVDAVESGEHLLEKLESGTYDVVITDNDMGDGMSGLQVLAAIMSDARHRTLPVIVLTGTEGLKTHVQDLGGIFADKGDFPQGLKIALVRAWHIKHS